MSITWEYENDNGECYDVEIPAHWEICGTCRGEGKHSRALGAITMEDRDQYWSEDEWEGYMNGDYDSPCSDCKGTGKVQGVDWAAFKSQNPEVHDAYDRYLQDMADLVAMERAERRMGC